MGQSKGDKYPQFLKINDFKCLRAVEFKKLLAARDFGRISQLEFATEDKKIDDLCWKAPCPFDTSGQCRVPTYIVQSISGQNRYFHWKGYVTG